LFSAFEDGMQTDYREVAIFFRHLFKAAKRLSMKDKFFFTSIAYATACASVATRSSLLVKQDT
jgi:hypothetical protein